MNPADPFGLIGQVLDGQFRVDALVGEGGFSIVYRGHHIGLDEPIAVKCLKLPAALGSALVESFMRRFRDESRLHYRLSQGNLAIARSIASGTTMSPSTSALVPYMVLEWLVGRSLAQDFELRKQHGLHGRSLDEMMKLLDTAAQGLAYAHAQGVVHRDINPGNLFLAETRQGPMTKVLDFGVAKVVSDHALELGPRAQTIGQIRIFAPAYGSPEQFDDSVGKVGPASDVYSFSLIALEVLRDAPVREGEHLGEFALMALDANALPTPRSLGIAVGDAVEEVFARAVAMRPQDRPSDVGELWGSLKNAMRVDAQSGKPPHANAVAPRAQAWKPHPPAAGQAPPDRPVTADMPAPIVEVSRPGSIAPPPVGEAPRPSYAGRQVNQTVRMQSAAPRPMVGDRSHSPPPVASGAAALAATPLTSTLMMEGANRILTPVPPTTRTGHMPSQEQTPMASPYARSQAVSPQAQSMATPPMTGGVAQASPQAAYGAPPPHPYATPMPPRSEVATVVPPKPRTNVAMIAVLVLLALGIAAGAAFGVYRVMTAKKGDAPAVASASTPVARVAPEAIATATPPVTPTPTASATVIATATATATAPVAPATAPVVATATVPATATATPTATPTVPTTATAPAPPASPSAFNPASARAALDVINGVLASCKDQGGKTGDGTITVTFSPDGRASHATVDEPPFAGTKEAQCVASRFKQAKIAPFEGAQGQVIYTFRIPK